jgi:hypothetical protein
MQSPLRSCLGALVTLSAVLSVGATAAAGAQARVPGYTYTVNMTVDSGAGKRVSMAMKHQVSANILRTEFVQMSGMDIPGGIDMDGMYTLMNGADSTTTTVVPSQHMAMVMNPMAMLGQAGYGRPEVSTDAKSSNILDLGDGGRILGHPTRHIRVTTSGSMTMKMGGRICRTDVSGESELWIAPDVDLAPAMQMEMKQYTQVYGGAVPTVTTSDRTPSLPKGTPLRTIMKQVAGGHTISTTMEYVEMSPKPMDPALFAVPSDYKTMDMRKMMAEMPMSKEIMDSAMVAASEKQHQNCDTGGQF